MKKNIILSAILSVLMYQISSSKIENTDKNNIVTFEKAAKTPVITDTVFDNRNKYYFFLKKNYPLDRIILFQEKDLDSDGKNVAVFTCRHYNEKGRLIENILALKNDNGNIKKITGDFGLENYSIEKIKFISLKGNKQNYIYIAYSDGNNKNGFAIYEILDNEVKQTFVTSALNKVVSAYHDKLTASNHDEKFDGHFESIQYAGFNIEKEFVFENNLFKLKNTAFVFKDYPSNIEEVIDQYLCIRSFDNDDNAVKQRLEQLCLDKTANTIPWEKKDWGFAYYSNILSNLPLLFVEKNKDGFTAKAFFRNSQLKFELQKTDGKWQITKIDAKVK